MAGLLTKIKRAINPPTPSARPAGRRHYEAARPDRVLDNHYAYAAGGPAADLVSADFRILRNRMRFEIRNNCYASGMSEAFANDIVGDGPTVVFDAGIEKLENDFAAWVETCDWLGYQDLGGMLRLAVKGLLDSGEAFFVRQIDGADTRLMAVDPERIDTPVGMVANQNIRDGIEFDNDGRVKGYYIANYHPANPIHGFLGQHKFVAADRVLHLFRVDRPGQHRGIPWLAPSIGPLAMLRSWKRATLKAAQRAANLALIMHTTAKELMDNEDYEPPTTFDEIEIPEDAMFTLPEGWEASQLKPEHPAASYEMFVADLLAEIGRPINMPLCITSGNASKYNFASGRLDSLPYRRQITIVRGLIHDRVLRPLTRERVRLLRLDPGLLDDPAQPLPCQWLWSDRSYDDQVKEANAAKTRLETLQSNLAIEIARTGNDHRKVIAQAGAIEKLKKKAGLTPPAAPKPAAPPKPPAPDDKNEPSQKDSKKEPAANAQ